MPAWGWVIVAAAVVAVAALVVWMLVSRRRSESLRRRFGPEYERAVEAHETRGEAEADLSQRLERRERLEIRPLSPHSRQRYLAEWRQVQEGFVDRPDGAVAEAHRLVRDVMAERGYPIEDFDQRVADLSVDHPVVVEHYRAAQTIAGRAARGETSTEELRQALRHYRALFDDLLDGAADEPLSREAAEHVHTPDSRGSETRR